MVPPMPRHCEHPELSSPTAQSSAKIQISQRNYPPLPSINWPGICHIPSPLNLCYASLFLTFCFIHISALEAVHAFLLKTWPCEEGTFWDKTKTAGSQRHREPSSQFASNRLSGWIERTCGEEWPYIMAIMLVCSYICKYVSRIKTCSEQKYLQVYWGLAGEGPPVCIDGKSEMIWEIAEVSSPLYSKIPPEILANFIRLAVVQKTKLFWAGESSKIAWSCGLSIKKL